MAKIILSMFLMVTLNSCGSTEQSALFEKKNDKKIKVFENSWKSKCVANSDTVVKFQKDKGAILNHTYKDNDCKELLLTHEVEFKFTKENKEKNLFFVDLTFGKAYYTVYTEEALDGMNQNNNICDFDFKLKIRTELLKNKCIKKITAQNGLTIYALIEHSNTKLFFGDDEDGEYTGTTKEKRAVKTNKDTFLKLQKKDS